MRIQLNTDAHIGGTEALAAQVSAMVQESLERFSAHIITQLEVHLSDENGDKSADCDGQPQVSSVHDEGLCGVAIGQYERSAAALADDAHTKFMIGGHERRVNLLTANIKVSF
jgi:hypothetical protein